MSAKPLMPDACFIDSNIWLYAFIESTHSEKTERARGLIETCPTIVVSTQVINEVCVNLVKKAKFSELQVQQMIESFYNKYSVVEPTREILLRASTLRQKHSFSFWDGLIIASALTAGASVLVSEDMQNGLWVESQLQILDPFEGAVVSTVTPSNTPGL